MGEIMSILHDLCQCHSTKTSHFLQRMPQTFSFTSYSFHDQVYNHPVQQPINYVVCSVEIRQCCSLNIGNEYVKMFSICFICKPSNGQCKISSLQLCLYNFLFCFSGTPVYCAKHNPIYCTSILLLLLLKWLVLVWQFVLIPQLHSFTSLGN